MERSLKGVENCGNMAPSILSKKCTPLQLSSRRGYYFIVVLCLFFLHSRCCMQTFLFFLVLFIVAILLLLLFWVGLLWALTLVLVFVLVLVWELLWCCYFPCFRVGVPRPLPYLQTLKTGPISCAPDADGTLSLLLSTAEWFCKFTQPPFLSRAIVAQRQVLISLGVYLESPPVAAQTRLLISNNSVTGRPPPHGVTGFFTVEVITTPGPGTLLMPSVGS